MAKLICTTIVSLDGYVNDEQGKFEWSEPASDVLAFINELERPVGTYLYGRRLYETMVYWETFQGEPDQPLLDDFTDLWRAADKIVYSSTLEAVSSARTRIERAFDPEAVRAMKDAAERDLSIGGPTLAAHAFRAGLVDELRLFVYPVIIGGGTGYFPGQVHVDLQLREERRFDNGVMYLQYLVAH
jgi:dihydrofolate reductase